MTELRSGLEAALGGAYRIEHELGGGGMSRVFVATETALGRKVVVKVLPPDLAGDLNTDRFRREVLVAAQLQHPHIVPLLSAGDAGGVPYLTMPFVEGESLRARLSREGELPVRTAVKILHDVASALAYAHRHGVVHRDIKPDNVLLQGDPRSARTGDALVADFGVAKALTAAVPSLGSLTSTGITLGTPAYMAPEQAAGDPAVDQRADVYAFGCLAYEMLGGTPPFHGRPIQQIYAAHITDVPDPIESRRQAVPPPLARLVMQCLEKHPADRPQDGGELLEQLDALGGHTAATDAPRALGQSVGTRPAAPKRERGSGSGQAVRSFVAYFIAFAAVAGAAWLAVRWLDVPGWVFPGAVIVMLLGAPVLAATALLDRAKDGARPLGGLAPRWLTWRRAALGGVAAVSVFAMVVAGYVLLRALGLGPVGSLAAAGVIRAREPVLVTDFGSPPNDSSLGTVVSEALRTDLTQSVSFTVVQPAQVRNALARMQRPAAPRLDFELAREVAEREGIRVILDGNVRAAGSRFVVSGRLVAADSDRVLAAFRETADDADAIIPAVDRLSKKLRGRVGESLRAVRESPPIEKVTTPSLEALRRYATAARAADVDNDFAKAQALLGEAITLDTGFAMAWRKLGIVLGNVRGPRSRVEEAMTKAYVHRDRLTDVERFLATAAYHTEVTHDREQAIAAYEALIDLQPENYIALNNVAILHERQRNFARAVELYRRAAAVDSTSPFQLTNLAGLQGSLGDTAGATRTLAQAARRFPGNPEVAFTSTQQAASLGRYTLALAKLDTIAQTRSGDLVWRTRVAMVRSVIATTHGRFGEAQRYDRDRVASLRLRGIRAADLIEALDAAWYDIWFRGERARGVARVERALAEHPIDSLPVPDRPYARVIEVFAEGGAVERAKRTLARMESVLSRDALADMQGAPDGLRGRIALAEARPSDAIDAFRRSDQGPCTSCALPNIARAYDLAGSPDSAIAVFERYLASTEPDRWFQDRNYLAGALKRLGELYEARGDRGRAASRYARFVELWKDADPELQPTVAEVRRRLRTLSGLEGGSAR